jgi:Kinesin-like protein
MKVFICNSASIGTNEFVFHFSMMGDNLDSSLKETTGIIPRFCHQLFDQIPSNMVAQVKISYLEIYNEFVYDLLSSERKALKVRESPDTGIFVSDLSVHGVSSFSEMQVKNVFPWVQIIVGEKVSLIISEKI